MGRSQYAVLSDGSGGQQENITNPTDVLAGMWADNKNPADLSQTSGEGEPGSGNTYTDLAAEAHARPSISTSRISPTPTS